MCKNKAIVETIKEMVKQNPNDMSLGEEVRRLFTIDLKDLDHETQKGECDCVCGKKQTKRNDN